MRRVVAPSLAVAWTGFAVLPWNAIGGGGFFAFNWLAQYPNGTAAPALQQLFLLRRLWFLPLGLLLLAPMVLLRRGRVDSPARRHGATPLIAVGAGVLVYVLAMALAIDIEGWTWHGFAAAFGPLPRRQPGLGYGALLVVAAALVLLCHGLALRGYVMGNTFVASAIGGAIAMVALFTLYPLARLFSHALLDATGRWSIGAFAARLTTNKIWGYDGVVWNTLQLGLMTASAATLLALCFVLIVTRSAIKSRRVLSVLSVLPMITPPFVIGLALILLFGRSGAINAVLEWTFGWRPTRWIYGMPGVWLAQTLALTPVAYLVLVGVSEGVSASLEEAAQTLRASPLKTFATVTLPLMTPGIANAFLLVFIESLADFGNPLLLGGNLEVLSTAIYFAVVGVQQDPGRASVLAVILLLFSLALFVLQRRLLGGRSFVTTSGKGDGRLRLTLPRSVSRAAMMLAVPWAALAVVVYLMIFAGGFFEKWGLNHALTLRHYVTAFGIAVEDGRLVWTGAAWSSFTTTLKLAVVSAPLTAAYGLTVAYLLDRQRFAGKRVFEFASMLTFAVPGTVVGIAYILAFNAPPIELANTGLILVACFIARDMTTSMRAGLAAMSQIDPSLDEASATMRASTPATVRRVILPLIRPAVVAALVYSFISAMTSISAVIFLTSPRFDMATVNIVGRAEVGEYGYATAYASVLIVLMVLAVILIRLIIGKRRLLRQEVAMA
jgi:iron(III) transport system permease protein